MWQSKINSDEPEKECQPLPDEEPPAEVLAAQPMLKPFFQVPFTISIELGRSQLKVNDVLDLGYHSVVVLDKQAGANLDILANGILIGRGEVVVVEDRAGIRINEILDNRG
jgi:flagellar motor switch protein FliN/FliY